MANDDILRLLIIDHTPDEAELLINVLRKGGNIVRPKYINDRESFNAALEDHAWDFILAARQVGSFLAIDVLNAMRHKKADTPVIIIVDDGSDLADHQVEAMRIGARDVIVRDAHDHLLLVVQRELENLLERRAHRRARHTLNESQKRYKALFGASEQAIAYILDGVHIHANSAYLDEFGYAESDDIASIPLMDLIAPDHQARFKDFMRHLIKHRELPAEIQLQGLRSDEKTFPLDMRFTEATYDGEECLQLTIKPQGGDSGAQDKLDEMARKDQVTGLFNRRHFMDALGEAVSSALNEEMRGAMLYIQLDTYALIKDTVGPEGTDTLIKDIAAILRETMPKQSLAARYGDDIFAVILKGIGLKESEVFAQLLCKKVKEHITETSGQSVTTTCSIGISNINEAVDGVDEVLGNAKNARDISFKEGGDKVHLFDPVEDVAHTESIEGDAGEEIRSALVEDRLSLVFQPIVSLHGDSTEQYEVFLRMIGRNGELFAGKALFVAAAREGLVVDLDKWVVERALSLLSSRHADGKETHFFIKISDAAIQDEAMLLFLSKVLKETGVKGDYLTFEISETSAVGQIKLAKAYVSALKQLRCSAALEHFGSSLNSYSILNHIDVDYLKIDSALVANISSDEECKTQVREIQEKARELGKTTIASNVQHTADLAALWQCGVHCAQGNAIQEPSDTLAYDFSEDDEGTISM